MSMTKESASFLIDAIDPTELPLALRDLVSNAARAAKDYTEAECVADWRRCRVAMEEVAKCAVDLMAYAERRVR